MKREERIIIRQCQKLSRNEIIRAAEKAAGRAGVPLEDFLEWMFSDLALKYKDEKMNKRLVIENKIRSLGIRLPNGTVNKEYRAEITLPDEILNEVENIWIAGEKDLGLDFLNIEPGRYVLTGKPVKTGDYRLKLRFMTVYDDSVSEIDIPVAFNPNPRDLWKNIPSDPDIFAFHKADSDQCYVKVEEDENGSPRKDIVAASQRGRSHAQEGKPRDDDFKVYHDPESDWYILTVADGAGSAKYSRKGSEVACKTVLDYCRNKLSQNYEFEKDLVEWASDRDNDDKRNKVTRQIINIIYKGAIKAHEEIRKVADAHEGYSLRDFATTLMFAICKKYDFGWFIASFWVGDGAMAIYDENARTVKLLGTPDEGEFSGQTRFLTMPEIFHDKDVYSKRLRMSIVPEFTALFLMTDGVSDPMFETERNLTDFNKWKEFYQKLKTGFPEDEIGGVDLSDDNEDSQNQLLKWLDFWSPGNHDDRTIAILY